MEALTSIEKRKGFVKVEDLCYYTEFNSSPDMPLPADLLNVTAINMRRKYVNQYLNYPITRQAGYHISLSLGKLTWLLPIKDVTIAEPRPVVTLTLSPPIMLQMSRYQIIFLFPYL